MRPERAIHHFVPWFMVLLLYGRDYMYGRIHDLELSRIKCSHQILDEVFEPDFWFNMTVTAYPFYSVTVWFYPCPFFIVFFLSLSLPFSQFLVFPPSHVSGLLWGSCSTVVAHWTADQRSSNWSCAWGMIYTKINLIPDWEITIIQNHDLKHRSFHFWLNFTY